MILQSRSLRKRDAKAPQTRGAHCSSAITSMVGTLIRFTARLSMCGIYEKIRLREMMTVDR